MRLKSGSCIIHLLGQVGSRKSIKSRKRARFQESGIANPEPRQFTNAVSASTSTWNAREKRVRDADVTRIISRVATTLRLRWSLERSCNTASAFHSYAVCMDVIRRARFCGVLWLPRTIIGASSFIDVLYRNLRECVHAACTTSCHRSVIVLNYSYFYS